MRTTLGVTALVGAIALLAGCGTSAAQAPSVSAETVDSGVEGAADALPEAPDAPSQDVDAPQCEPQFTGLSPIAGCGWTGERGSPWGIWGSSPDDIYVVGRNGFAKHFDGQKWGNLNLGTYENLWGVWGASSSNVFITSSRWVYRFDGHTWGRQQVDGQGLGWIWGLSDCDVFGFGARIYHFDGSSWEPFPSPGEPPPSRKAWGFAALWGTSDSDLFLVGNVTVAGCDGYGIHGKIAHYDGKSWTEMVEDAGTQLNAIWAASPTSIYVAGGFNATGLVMHYDGQEWSTVFADAGAELKTIWGRSDSDIYAAGVGGTIVHFDGTKWSKVLADLRAGVFEDIHGTSDGIWLTSDNGIEHWDGSALSFSYEWPTVTSIEALGGCSENDVFAAGFGTSDSAGAPLVLRYQGDDWHPMSVPGVEPLWGIWCAGPDDVYAVGWNSTVLHFNGTSWVRVSVPGASEMLQGVWSSSPEDVFVVGEHGTVLHFNGQDWTTLATGTDAWLRAVSGTGPSDVYAVGDGAFLHYDGSSWSQVSAGDRRSVWAADASNIFAVAQGSIQRFDGTAWTTEYTAPYSPQVGFVEYTDVWSPSADSVWAVGMNRAITHFDGTKYETVTDAPQALFSIWGAPGTNPIVAGAEVILRYRCF